MNEIETLKIEYSAEDLQKRVAAIGKEITKDYKNKPLVLIGILKGSLYFFADLTRAIDLPIQVDLISIGVDSNLNDGSENVCIIKDTNIDISEKHLIIVEDIIRTGLTLGYLVQKLETRNPASIKICSLFINPEQQLIDIPIAYSGFSISSERLLGYGMDVNDKWRNLPYIVKMNKNTP